MTELVERKKFRPPIERDAVARDWRERGYSCGLFIDPPGREWLDFRHESNELLTVVTGKLEVEVSGESYVVEPGDEVFIPRRALHSVRNVHKAESRWLYGYD